MRSALHRADSWLFAAGPAEALGVLRILVGFFTTTYLVLRVRAFLVLADPPTSGFEPVGILAAMDGPMPRPVVVGVVVGSIALGIAFTLGAWFRITGPAFGVLVLVATTYRSSWGQLLYFENLMVLHVLIVGFARSADALSFDARRRPERRGVEVSYGWPVRLAALVTVVTYVLAGVAKLRLGGIDWMLGDSLRNHVAYSAARLDVLGDAPSPIAGPAVAHGWLFPPLAVATVAVELAAPIALLGGWIRTLWVTSAWLMHAGIAVLMFVVFPYPLFLLAFAPLFPLEQVPDRLGRLVPRMVHP